MNLTLQRKRLITAALTITLILGGSSQISQAEHIDNNQPKNANQTRACNPLALRHTLLPINSAANQLWADLTALSADELQGRKTGTKGSFKAQKYLKSAFKQAGMNQYSTDYLHPFRLPRTGPDVLGTNVIGWLAGSELPNSYIVITAHYDHIGRDGLRVYNGADDNASGVAAMLAMARQIKQKPLRHSVIFVATDAEELGLYGAKAFVATPPVALENIKYNINLDMIAQQGVKRRLFVAGSKTAPQLTSAVNKSLSQASLCLIIGHDKSGRSYDRRYKIDWKRASDHYPFYQQGIPYLFFSVDDHKHYHTTHDTVSKIDKTFYTAAVETVLNTLRLVDGED